MKNIQKNDASLSILKQIDAILPFLLLLAFTLCAMFTILIGNHVYTNIETRNQTLFAEDTPLAYITNKVRQSDCGNIEVRQIEDTSVLVLTSIYDEEAYETWIYSKDDMLTELFSAKDSGLSLEDGITLIPSPLLQFSLDQKTGLLRINDTCLLSIRSTLLKAAP